MNKGDHSGYNNHMAQKETYCKILLLSHVSDLRGGAEKSLLQIALELKKRNLDPCVIVPLQGTIQKELQANKIRTEVLGSDMPWWIYGPAGFPTRAQDVSYRSYSDCDNIIDKLVIIIRKHPSLKLTVTNTSVVPWLAYASAITGIRHAWMLREFVGNSNPISVSIGSDQFAATVNAFSEKVFVNSYAMKEYYERLLNKNDIDVIYPAVQYTKPKSVPSPYRQSALKLVLVGQLAPHKDQMCAIKAVKHLKDWGYDIQLTLIGAEEHKDYTKSIKKLVDQLKINDDIIFLGFMERPQDIVQYADIALVTSSHEPFGRVTIEAMLQGKTVIGAASDGTKEILFNRSVGILYKAGDDLSLAQSIKYLSNKPNLRNKIGKAAKEYASASFAPDEASSKFISYCQTRSLKKLQNLTLEPIQGLIENYHVIAKNYHILQNEKTVLINENDVLKISVTNLTHEISQIKTSRSWRLIHKINHILKRTK